MSPQGAGTRRAVATALAWAAACVLVAGPLAVPAAAAPPPAVRVSPAGSADQQQPSVAADPAHPGRLALAFQDGGRRRCWLSTSADTGGRWSTRALVGPGGAFPIPGGFGACWDPSVAFGPGGRLYYLFQSSLAAATPYSEVWLAASADGGATFSAPVAVDPGVPARAGRAGGDWWPAMAVDARSGGLWVAWDRFYPFPLETSAGFVAYSGDGGASFSAPERASPPDELDVSAPVPALGARGQLYMAWVDYTAWERGDAACGGCAYYGGYDVPTAVVGRALAAFAADHHLAFAPQTVGCVAFQSRRVYYRGGPVVVTLGGRCAEPGVIEVAAAAGPGRPLRLLASPGTVDLGCASEAAIDSPEAPAHVCDATHPSLYDHNVVAISAGGAPGRVVATWWASGDPISPAAGRVFVASSSDGAQAWQVGALLLPKGAVADGFHRPALSEAPDGRVDLACYDLTPGGGQEVWWAWAAGGRGAFSVPARVDRVASAATVGPAGDVGWASVGDHLGVASTDREVVVAWTAVPPGGRHQVIEVAAWPPDLGRGGGGGLPAAALGAAGAAVVAGGLAGWGWRRRRRRSGRGGRSRGGRGAGGGRPARGGRCRPAVPAGPPLR